MAAEIPDDVPASLRVGDTWRWTASFGDYPASAWTLKYRFKSPAAGFEVTAAADGDDYAVTVAATTTAGYTAGTYTWVAWVENGSSEVYTLATGITDLDASLRAGTASAALDLRTHAAKTLAAIEAWIEGRDPGVAEYEIAGRRMRYIPIADLLKLRQVYRAEVQAEQQAIDIARGLGTPRKIQFRL